MDNFGGNQRERGEPGPNHPSAHGLSKWKTLSFPFLCQDYRYGIIPYNGAVFDIIIPIIGAYKATNTLSLTFLKLDSKLIMVEMISTYLLSILAKRYTYVAFYFEKIIVSLMDSSKIPKNQYLRKLGPPFG